MQNSPADAVAPAEESRSAGAAGAAPSLLSLAQLLRISALWWGLQFFWASQQLIVMPERVRHFVPIEDLGSYYGMIKSFGALMVLTTQLIVGFLSDHAESRLGRRRPFVLWGTLYGFGAIVFFMFAPGFWWLFAAYMLIELFINAASVPFQALLPDLVPKQQHDRAGALMGVGHLGGAFIGLLVVLAMKVLFRGELNIFGQVLPEGYIKLLLPLYFIALIGTMLVVVLGVDEHGWAQYAREKLSGTVLRFKLLPGTLIQFSRTAPTALGTILQAYTSLDLRRQPNFNWLALSRFAVFLGYQTFQAYVAYYTAANLDGAGWLMSLGLSADKAEEMKGMVLPAMLMFFLLGGVAGNLLSTPLAARFGKKWVIGAGLISSGLLFIPLIFTGSVWVAVSMGLFIGVGWGAFISSDWAFACSLMPKTRTGAFMGIWDFTTLMPQVLAPMLGGPLRDVVFKAQAAKLAPGQDPATLSEAIVHACEAPAHQLLFALIILWFAIGFVLLRFVKEERPAAVSAS